MTEPQWQKLRFCSRCGAALGRRVAGGRERPACPSCGFVVYLDPKVACAVLVERAGALLLVRRRREPGRGLWCLPCGFEDADESPQQAALREAREETGLAVTLGRLLGAYHYTADPRGPGVLLVFLASCAPGAAPAPGDDADAAGFFAPGALPPISHHTHRAAIDDWRQTMHRTPREAEIERLHQQVRQLILMRETGPKRAGWHAARARLIWRLQREIARLEAAEEGL